MKKSHLLLLVIIFIAPYSIAFAGDDEGGKKGVRAGWQLSNIHGNGNTSGDNLNSFYVGVFGEKKIVPMLRLGIGVEYNSVGRSLEVLNVTNKFVRHSIALPVYLKLKLGTFYALGGLAANFGISNTLTVGDTKADIEDEDKPKALDIPAFLGIGFKVAVISFEARYHLGTINLDKEDNSNLKQQYFQLGAAIAF
ncbi:MAG: hypothetical protein ACI9GM_001458 [Salibacteraceae bacterium]|jgi:hypothetical protein